LVARREGLGYGLTTQQDRTVDRELIAERLGHDDRTLFFAVEARAVLDDVAGIEADRLRHLHDQDVVPQPHVAAEQRVVVRQAGTRQGVRLDLAERRVLGELRVLRRRYQLYAKRLVLGSLVTLEDHRRRRQRDLFHVRAHAVHGIHGEHVGGGQVDFAGIDGKRRDAIGAVADEM